MQLVQCEKGAATPWHLWLISALSAQDSYAVHSDCSQMLGGYQDSSPPAYCIDEVSSHMSTATEAAQPISRVFLPAGEPDDYLPRLNPTMEPTSPCKYDTT